MTILLRRGGVGLETFINFLAPYSEMIKTLTIVSGGVFTLYKLMKNVFEQYLNTRLSGIEGKLTHIEETNIKQNENIEKILHQQNLLMQADQDILRSMITSKYYEAIERESFPQYERECLTLIYRDYKTLNGNSFIDLLYEELLKLPTEQK